MHRISDISTLHKYTSNTLCCTSGNVKKHIVILLNVVQDNWFNHKEFPVSGVHTPFGVHALDNLW